VREKHTVRSLLAPDKPLNALIILPNAKRVFERKWFLPEAQKSQFEIASDKGISQHLPNFPPEIDQW
jgi:hypothetical protein